MEWDWNPASVGAIATAVASLGTLVVLYFIRRTAEDTKKGLALAEEQARQTAIDTRKGLELAEQQSRIALRTGRTTARLDALSTLMRYHVDVAQRGGRDVEKAGEHAKTLEKFLESLSGEEDDEL